jgi:aspartate dehydrogenase
MRIAVIGGGTIARLVLDHARRASLGRFEVVALMGRPGGAPRARELAREFSVKYVENLAALASEKPQAVIEAASHAAVKEHLVGLLDAGIAVVVLSAGALIDDALREAAEGAARRSGALLFVPSGGIGGLDALKTACLAYVESRGIALDDLRGPLTLFDGTAREGVPHFPQNVNIAAILALGGIGPDRTRLKVVADPALTLNTHTIRVSGRSGRFILRLENVPAPENPKTSWLACYSALAALQALGSPIRYGT